MFFRYVVFRCAPWPNSLVVRGLNVLSLGSFYPAYLCWYRRLEEAVKQWHSQEFCKSDPMFLLDQQSKKLILAREKAREAGIGPLDPAYPDIFSFSDPDVYDRIQDSLDRIKSGYVPFWKGR